MRAGRIVKDVMVDEDYVWFDEAQVVLSATSLMVLVGKKVVPLPLAILHPDCTLAQAGDVGRLGVPRQWAAARGLVGDNGSLAR